jgi:hypothetical protein
MRKLNLALMASFLMLFSGFLYSANALSNGYFSNLAGSDGQCGLLSFDRESCEQDCRSRFGVDLYELQRHGGGFRGPGTGGYYAYAQCIQSCNTRFWKDFDRDMRDLEREKVE